MYKTLEDVERVISNNKPQHVIDMFISSYLQGMEYTQWLAFQELEHMGLYPLKIDGEPILDVDEVTILGYKQLDNPDYIEFDVWMQETEEVESGFKDIFDEDGFTVIDSEPIYTDKLIRTYSEVPIDVEAWKTTDEVYKTYLDGIKEDKLAKLTVTTSTGKVFYADASSRSDLTDAIMLGNLNNVSETTWKLAEEFEGSRIVIVTIQELAEAAYLALQSKGQIIGAI